MHLQQHLNIVPKRVSVRSRQTGFTLIELIMVVIILGVLAAVAIPKFINLSADADAAAAQSVAGSLTSAAAVNYAARSTNGAYGTAMKTCASVVTTLQGGALPTSGGTYSVYDATDTTNGTTVVTAGTVGSCTLKFVPTTGNTVNVPYIFTSIN